jgi:hypothetical protein
MKTIFLDIDGVLATNKQFSRNREKFKHNYKWAEEYDVPYPYDEGCVKILNEIVESTGAQIVLSSDWKLHYNLGTMGKIFEANGIKTNPVDTTEDFGYSGLLLEMWRASEIVSYIDKHDVGQWVVIDDLNMEKWFNDYEGGKGDRFFITRNRDGLKKSSLKDKIINKLNE